MSAIEQQVHSAPPVAAEQSAAHAGSGRGTTFVNLSSAASEMRSLR